MWQLRCGHGRGAQRRSVRGAGEGGADVEAVTVADRRHVHTWVPVADVPQSAPAELGGVARAVTVEGRIVGWWFDVGAALAAGDTGAPARFSRWASRFTHRRLLGESATVDAAVAQLAPSAGGHLDLYLEDRFCALGGADLEGFLAAEYDVEVAAVAATGPAVELLDPTGRAVPGRVWPATEPLTLTEVGAVAVSVEGGAMWCTVGDTRLQVAGWRIDGDSGDVIVDTGDEHLTLDAVAGTVLTRQAAGQVQVQVRTRPFAQVCSEVAEVLFDAADAAARAGRYLLIGVEPARPGT